jgi:hypothetical protein
LEELNDNTGFIHHHVYDQLTVSVYQDNETMGQAAAKAAVSIIQRAIADRGTANILLATGNSQLTFLHSLRYWPDIPWEAINVFHMDEYLLMASWIKTPPSESCRRFRKGAQNTHTLTPLLTR